jgi:3D (Asp-Asp-Asp) domain-containing protein
MEKIDNRPVNYCLPYLAAMVLGPRCCKMFKYIRVTIALAFAGFLASCAEQPVPHVTIQSPSAHRTQKVRTTAYTHTERGGRRNALGTYLSGRHVLSAASDWSRFPLGTRFRIVDTKEEYVIDDYGTALVGTNTIDLYKTSRLEMRRWGVRTVDIDILQWGSDEQSLKVLTPRAKHRQVHQMIVALHKKAAPSAAKPIASAQKRAAVSGSAPAHAPITPRATID